MKRFLIRYGVFSLLAIMLAGISWMAGHYEIRTKYPVTLVADDAAYRAYIGTPPDYLPAVGDTLRICQTAGGDLAFTVAAVGREHLSVRLTLHPADRSAADRLNGNTCTTGFIFTGREKLFGLIRRKIGF